MYTQNIYNCKWEEEKSNRYKHVMSDDVIFIAKAVAYNWSCIIMGFFLIHGIRELRKL